jgi:Xaa-Pro aminopeptidase
MEVRGDCGLLELFMKTILASRRRSLRARLAEAKLPAIVSTNPASWYYLTGFTGEAGVLLVSSSRCVLVTDGRFVRQAKEETRGVQVLNQQASLMGTVGQLVKGLGLRKIGYDAGQLSVLQLQALRRAAGRKAHWVNAEGQAEALRQRKDGDEIQQMRTAAQLAVEVMNGVLRLLRPGVREIEVGAEIEYQMRKRGASGPAFETIVAFGERSAYPHARPTSRRLRKNELVVLDLGAILGHYCSDITRTVFVGRAPKRIHEWYRAVQEAQSRAVSAVRVGVSCGDVDAAARSTLANYKLDKYFVHSTGHGLGLEVHENPRVARNQKQVLVPGNVITIEPGVYVPGVGGIRIEDDVAVHAERTEVLTRFTRDLIEI